uniref:Uncharacterized protein n=1 Tax=Oncorhynchus kisutch TaxID=8019 RepID=A0A8C7INM4_ONCKI
MQRADEYLLHLDVGSVRSVLCAAHKVKYTKLDYLYLKAGIMPNPQIDIKEVFATNLFGHFMLVSHVLSDLIVTFLNRERFVSNGNRAWKFKHKGQEPDWWSAAEMVILLEGSPISTEELWCSVRVTIEFLVTSLTKALLPRLRPGLGRVLVVPNVFHLKMMDATMFLGTFNHSLFVQKPESLDPRAKYHCLTSDIGSNYTQPRQMDVDDDVSEALYVKLLEMEKATHKRLKEEDDDKQAYKKYLHQTESSFVRLFSSTDLV